MVQVLVFILSKQGGRQQLYLYLYGQQPAGVRVEIYWNIIENLTANSIQTSNPANKISNNMRKSEIVWGNH